MKKAYYKCPLQAAYMSKEFGVNITALITNDGCFKQSDKPMLQWEWGRIVNERSKVHDDLLLAKRLLKSQYIIMPDSMSMLVQRIEDLVAGILELQCYYVVKPDGLYGDVQEYFENQEIPLSFAKSGNCEIIQRDNKAFFWPQFEEQENN